MKYYTYSGRKSQSRAKASRKRLIVRIAVIAAAVILSVALALIIGNHLKHKLEDADISTQPLEELFEPIEKFDDGEGIDLSKNDRAEGETSAVYGYFGPDGCPDADGAKRNVAALAECGYTGILFNVRNGEGKYAYASVAASDAARVPLSTDTVSLDVLKAAVGEAGARGMRSAAYIDLGDVTVDGGGVGFAIDSTVIEELSSIGFSQVILDGIARGHEFTADFARTLASYITPLRAKCGSCDFALVVDLSVFDDPENTPPLEIVFRFSDLFAVDLTDASAYGADEVRGILENYGGFFGAYSVMSLVDGSRVGTIRDYYEVFSSVKYPNVGFLTPRSDVPDGFSSRLETYSLKDGE